MFPAAAGGTSGEDEMEVLRRRLELLDRENQLLRMKIASCPLCSKEEAPTINSACNVPNTSTKQVPMKKSSGHLRTIEDHAKRYVALKVMYFGPRFFGFASEAQQEPTVESEIFKALGKTRLSTGNKADLCYSRCGRTDKGVSSTGQVIALYLRSKLKDAVADATSEEEEEIDYVKVLNRALPNDIRVIEWSAVSTNFHARFGCLSREYRNFCKMDAENVKNYVRKITSFEIAPCNERSDYDELWVMTIKGSAFLWHQVRCMVAVLCMIGEGHESPGVIDLLLDTSKVPRKPQYKMAPELPLVLRSCKFTDTKFMCSPEAKLHLHRHLKKELHNYLLQAAIFREALYCLSSSDAGENNDPFEDIPKKKSHIPLLMRQTEPSYEERRARLNQKNKNTGDQDTSILEGRS